MIARSHNSPTCRSLVSDRYDLPIMNYNFSLPFRARYLTERIPSVRLFLTDLNDFWIELLSVDSPICGLVATIARINSVS